MFADVPAFGLHEMQVCVLSLLPLLDHPSVMTDISTIPEQKHNDDQISILFHYIKAMNCLKLKDIFVI